MILPFQYALEHFGVAVAAVTGVLAARGRRIDLFGVMVLALVTAFGGGTIRDCTLGDFPVFWARDPNYVLTGVITAGVFFYLARRHEVPRTLLLVADAFALALFSIVGITKALHHASGLVIGVVMGVITGVAGGILRDLLLGEIPVVFRRQTYLYATAAFLGTAVFGVVNRSAENPRLATAAGLITILGLRLAGIRWKLALPVFVAKDPPPPPPEVD